MYSRLMFTIGQPPKLWKDWNYQVQLDILKINQLHSNEDEFMAATNDYLDINYNHI